MADSPIMVKCLVWDLDNTLWTGTLLEGDIVELTDAVREIIGALDARGILQSVASKNDSDLAWARLEELRVAEYFVLPHIGWGPKSDAVRAIADQMNFAHNTIAFIDDQPAERAEVALYLPEVRCYSHTELPILLGLPEFNPQTSTVDSRRRREMYQASFRRDAERDAFNGPDEDYLRSLELELRIDRADSTQLSRVEELTLRTSQMNATGVHYSDAMLRQLCSDATHEVLVATLTDRFGPYGAIGVLLLDKKERCWHLKLLATSCRVVSLGVGATILNWLIDQAAQANTHLVADFRPTERNRMMEIAYRFAGFGEEDCVCLPEPADAEDIEHLHLAPQRRELSTALRTITADLVGLGSPFS